MDLSTQTMDIVFRRVLPERVIEDILNDSRAGEPQKSLSNVCINQNRFLQVAESALSGYSLDEQKLIHSYIVQKITNDVKDASHSKASISHPFNLILDYARDKIEVLYSGPRCLYKNVLEWRAGYLLLGQDIFTTAVYAARSVDYGSPSTFAWPAVIPSDNSIISSITGGIAENHLHLYAGASNFPIIWCSLMNNPKNIHNLAKQLPDNLQVYHSRGVSGNMWPMDRRMLYAAYFRAVLFSVICGEKSEVAEHYIRDFHNSYSNCAFSCSKTVRPTVDYLRIAHGLPFYQPRTRKNVCLDYAFCPAIISDIDKDYRLLAGERYFLFSCFSRCFTGELSEVLQQVFYAYLLLKSQLRSEFVQVNGQTGFANFSNYDRRKTTGWTVSDEYWNEDYRQALNASLSEQKLISLEGRIIPKDTVSSNVNLIYDIDFSKLFFDAKSSEEKHQIESWKHSRNMENKARSEPYYFVLHFPKEKDLRLKPDSNRPTPCRHSCLRQKNRRTALAIAKALSNYQYFCERVRGIDACSNEIGCRPEVFANAFRFLRAFPVKEYRDYSVSTGMPRISATYHVGEDFLDISDGLRAMDEAIWFLGLRRGDRLGHALALGVDPKTHYKMKGMRIVLPKQDFLDNLVWILFRGAELNIDINDSLRCFLQARATSLLREIYDIPGMIHLSTLDEYYHSMLLRGDDPSCYETKKYLSPHISAFDNDRYYYRFGVNDSSGSLPGDLSRYRNDPNVAYLYYLYHFNKKCREKGSEVTTMRINDEYIIHMEKMQKKMQSYIDSVGLSIECNPSSNVLIGTFGSYDKHPVLRFNSIGLGSLDRDTQMHVSINSDDPGVFDTSISFEYDLLAAALSGMRDDKGGQLYSNREIETYLQNIARMGREQVFK